ncbi:hypothetical protein CsSME_00006976 [Camellia sinensis var. sinensis]
MQSTASKAFEKGEKAEIEKYADEAWKFENRGFKHGWLKAIIATQVSLDVLIPFERKNIEPLESNLE